MISVKTLYIRKVNEMAFKNTIKEIRLNNRLSKVEMAKKLDVSVLFKFFR